MLPVSQASLMDLTMDGDRSRNLRSSMSPGGLNKKSSVATLPSITQIKNNTSKNKLRSSTVTTKQENPTPVVNETSRAQSEPRDEIAEPEAQIKVENPEELNLNLVKKPRKIKVKKVKKTNPYLLNPYQFGEPYDPDKFTKISKVCSTPDSANKTTKHKLKINFKEPSKSPSALRKTNGTLIVEEARNSSFSKRTQIKENMEKEKEESQLPNIQFTSAKPEQAEKIQKIAVKVKKETN